MAELLAMSGRVASFAKNLSAETVAGKGVGSVSPHGSSPAWLCRVLSLQVSAPLAMTGGYSAGPCCCSCVFSSPNPFCCVAKSTCGDRDPAGDPFCYPSFLKQEHVPYPNLLQKLFSLYNPQPKPCQSALFKIKPRCPKPKLDSGFEIIQKILGKLVLNCGLLSMNQCNFHPYSLAGLRLFLFEIQL